MHDPQQLCAKCTLHTMHKLLFITHTILYGALLLQMKHSCNAHDSSPIERLQISYLWLQLCKWQLTLHTRLQGKSVAIAILEEKQSKFDT